MVGIAFATGEIMRWVFGENVEVVFFFESGCVSDYYVDPGTWGDDVFEDLLLEL